MNDIIKSLLFLIVLSLVILGKTWKVLQAFLQIYLMWQSVYVEKMWIQYVSLLHIRNDSIEIAIAIALSSFVSSF